MADDMRLADAERIHQRDDVAPRDILTVARRIGGDVGRRIAALAVGDATMRPGEAAHLRLPGAVVAGEFMHEDNGRARAGFFVIEMDAVRGFDLGHSMRLIPPGGRSRAALSPRHGTKNAG